MVAVYHIALLVHGQAAVGVSVKGEAHIQAVIQHELLQLADMGGAAVHVDIQSVGPVGNHMGVGPQGVEDALGHLPGAAVGAVQTDLEVLVGTGCQRNKVAYVAVSPGGIVHGAAYGIQLSVGQLLIGVQISLDTVQQIFLHLLPVAVNELDAVVVVGVVAGGDHDAAVKVIGSGNIGHAGGAGDMEQVGVCPGGGEPGAQRRLEHVTGSAGGLAYDHLCLMIFAVIPAQIAPYLKGVVHSEINVGFSSEAVGSEIFTQKNSLPLKFSCRRRVNTGGDIQGYLQEGSGNIAVGPAIYHLKNRIGLLLAGGQQKDVAG